MPSAEAPTVDKDMDRTTHCYHLAFMWLALFVTPLLLTLHTLLQRFDQLNKTLRVQYAHTGFGSACLYDCILVAAGAAGTSKGGGLKGPG